MGTTLGPMYILCSYMDPMGYSTMNLQVVRKSVPGSTQQRTTLGRISGEDCDFGV